MYDLVIKNFYQRIQQSFVALGIVEYYSLGKIEKNEYFSC